MEHVGEWLLHERFGTVQFGKQNRQAWPDALGVEELILDRGGLADGGVIGKKAVDSKLGEYKAADDVGDQHDAKHDAEDGKKQVGLAVGGGKADEKGQRSVAEEQEREIDGRETLDGGRQSGVNSGSSAGGPTRLPRGRSGARAPGVRDSAARFVFAAVDTGKVGTPFHLSHRGAGILSRMACSTRTVAEASPLCKYVLLTTRWAVQGIKRPLTSSGVT